MGGLCALIGAYCKNSVAYVCVRLTECRCEEESQATDRQTDRNAAEAQLFLMSVCKDELEGKKGTFFQSPSQQSRSNCSG